jgi:DNA repair exonuclease SbcCD nuclease subunit
MTFKFLHTADIHLDSPLLGLSAYEGAPAERLRAATREAFVNVVNLAIEEEVAFVVVAGDLYDGSWKDYNTGLFFARQVGRLREKGILVYLLDGNHDAESEMARQLKPPDNALRFSTRKAQTFRLDSLRVALHGRGFRERATPENLVASYPEAVEGWFNIGVLHTSLEGNAQHATYAPCSAAELRAKGYQYWALGHVHERRVVSEAPHIVYPGNPQGRHIRETGPRGVTLVEVSDNGGVTLEECHTDVLRWHRLDVDVSAAQDFESALALARRKLETCIHEQADGLPVAVRVELTGRTAAHGALLSHEVLLRPEILAHANALGEDAVWIEKVRVRTTPRLDADERQRRSDALVELGDLVAAAASDEAFVQGLRKDLVDFLGKVEPEVRQSDELKVVAEDRLGELIDEAAPALLARLEETEG